MSNHGVWSGPYLSIEQLCSYAIDNKFSHLWIMSDQDVHQDAYNLGDAWHQLPTWENPPDVAAVLKDNRLRGVYAYRKAEGRTKAANIIFTKFSEWAWLQGDDYNAAQLVNRAYYLEKFLGVPVGGSPGNCGMKYLTKKLNEKRHPEWLQKPNYDLSTLPFEQSSTPLVWDRVPTEQELSCEYAWCLDKNSAHTRAAKEEYFGVGEPEEWQGGYVDKWPGVWRINNISGAFNNLMPPPVWDGATWVASPILKLLTHMGFTFEIEEGYYFPRYEKVLSGWASGLWDVREAMPQGPARTSIKQVMNDTIGLFRSKRYSSYRPDWYAQIVAGSYANIMYNIVKAAKEGYYPVMVQVDAITYLSNEPVPGMLDHTTSLGGYKLKWKLKVTDEVRSILTSDMSMSTAQKSGMLNRIAERVQ